MGWGGVGRDGLGMIKVPLHLLCTLFFIIIASALPQTIWHYILQVRDPWIRDSSLGGEKTYTSSQLEPSPQRNGGSPTHHSTTKPSSHRHRHTHNSLLFSQLFSTLYLQTKIIRHSRKDPTLTENTSNRLKKEP